MPGASTLLLSTRQPSIRMLLSPITTLSSTVADLSRQPWPTVTYFPMTVAADSPVGDVLQQIKAPLQNSRILLTLLPDTCTGSQ